MLDDDLETPRVFFSYSYRASEELKSLFRRACVETGVSPVFADEVRLGESLTQKIRQLILSCDGIVVAITEPFSLGISFEVTYSQAINKPIFFFVKKPFYFLPFDFSRFRYTQYETSADFLQLLSAKLQEFKPKLKRTEAVSIKKEQNKITDFLKDSLQENVLVLGKDSDEKGLAKMERISYVLRANRYVPVKLKELPEIKHLSLETKMIIVAGLSRFVIAEDSRPSGHIDEVRLCAECQYITATVREVGTGSTWMQAHYPDQYRFMNRFCYSSPKKKVQSDTLCKETYDSLEQATEKAIVWAEDRIKVQEKNFGRTYSNF